VDVPQDVKFIFYQKKMKMEIEKIPNITAASFERKLNKITDGQKRILNLLNENIKSGEPITMNQIIDIYFQTVSDNGDTIRIRYNLGWEQKTYCKYADKNDPEIRIKAINWFKNNLGSCIIKGRLLAIPIIEIED
jgi:hypothetical protein